MTAERPPSRPVVLVVDDEEPIRALLADVLADLGYEAAGAADAAGAFAALERFGDRVRLAIVDLFLPGEERSGVEILRALRARRPGLPGIISTGDEHAAAAAGEFPLLRKPYRIDELERAIERALRPKGADK